MYLSYSIRIVFYNSQIKRAIIIIVFERHKGRLLVYSCILIVYFQHVSSQTENSLGNEYNYHKEAYIAYSYAKFSLHLTMNIN